MKITIPRIRISVKELLRWQLVFLIIALSGCVYFTQVTRRNTTIVFFALTIISMYIEHKKLNRKCFFMASGMSIVLVLNYILNISGMNNTNLIDYALLIIAIICIAGCTSVISFDDFSSKYIRIMEIISVVSLICFYIQISNVSLVHRIANTAMLKGYTISWFHTWGWSYIFSRNAGPFWEPGAFQGYLFIAVLLLLRTKDFEKHYGELALLVFTIITTMSTTGYILLGIFGMYFMFLYAKKSMKTSREKGVALLRIFTIFIVVLVGVQYLMNSGTVVNKLNSANESYAYRILHLTNSFSMVMERSVIGYGIMSQKLINMWGQFGVATNSVGLFTILQYFGIFTGSLYIILNFRSTLRVFRPLNGSVICAFFVVLHLTESLLLFPVYISFMFLSLGFNKNRENCE